MVQTVLIAFVAPITAVIDQVTDLFPGNTFGVSAHKVPVKKNEVFQCPTKSSINIIFTYL